MKLPQLSLPWAIFASVVFCVLGALVFAGKVTGRELALFVSGCLIPMLRSNNSVDPPAGGAGAAGAAVMALCFCLGCASVNREIAKDQYTLDLQGCHDHAASRADEDTCDKAVRAKWDEAGAPPAAKLDAGVQ